MDKTNEMEAILLQLRILQMSLKYARDVEDQILKDIMSPKDQCAHLDIYNVLVRAIKSVGDAIDTLSCVF